MACIDARFFPCIIALFFFNLYNMKKRETKRKIFQKYGWERVNAFIWKKIVFPFGKHTLLSVVYVVGFLVLA